MACPITHIVLADSIFEEIFPGKDRRDFFIGTSLPDIRYLENFDRSRTHLEGFSLADLEKESSFMAGFKFHSFLDEIWNGFYANHPDYPFFIEPTHISDTALKFLADEMIYGRFGGWPEIIGYLADLIQEELRMDIPEDDLKRWHEELRKYFSQKPTDESRTDFIEGIGLGLELADEVEDFIKEMKSNEKLLSAMEQFYEKFGQLVRSNQSKIVGGSN